MAIGVERRQNLAMSQKHQQQPRPVPPALSQPDTVVSEPSAPGRLRVTVDVSPAVSALLDHYCDVTGQTRSSVILGLLMAQLPAMAELADNLKRRSVQLIQAKR